MTIDLQIAIIEKIKKIKQKKIEDVLTYHLTLLFVVAFCLNLKKKKNAQRCSIGGVKYL